MIHGLDETQTFENWSNLQTKVETLGDKSNDKQLETTKPTCGTRIKLFVSNIPTIVGRCTSQSYKTTANGTGHGFDTPDHAVLELNELYLATFRWIDNHFGQNSQKMVLIHMWKKVKPCVDTLVELMTKEYVNVGMMYANSQQKSTTMRGWSQSKTWYRFYRISVSVRPEKYFFHQKW